MHCHKLSFLSFLNCNTHMWDTIISSFLCTVGLNSRFNSWQALERCPAGGTLSASCTVQRGSFTNPRPFRGLVAKAPAAVAPAGKTSTILEHVWPERARVPAPAATPAPSRAAPARAWGSGAGGAAGGAGRRWRARGGGHPSPSRSGSSRAAHAARLGCVAARDPSHPALAWTRLLPPPHSPARPRRAAPGPPLPPCPPLTQSVPHQLQHGGSAALSSAGLQGPPAGECRPRRRAAPGAAEWGPSPGPRRRLGGRWRRRRSQHRGAWASVTARVGAAAAASERAWGGRPRCPRAYAPRKARRPGCEGQAALGASRVRAAPGREGVCVRSCERGPRRAGAQGGWSGARGLAHIAPGVGSARPAVPLRSRASRGSVPAASAPVGLGCCWGVWMSLPSSPRRGRSGAVCVPHVVPSAGLSWGSGACRSHRDWQETPLPLSFRDFLRHSKDFYEYFVSGSFCLQPWPNYKYCVYMAVLWGREEALRDLREIVYLNCAQNICYSAKHCL